MDRIEQAAQLKQTCNCCQAVLLAYADVLGKSEAELSALGKCFGSGMGGMQGTCGALVGAEMVMSLTGGNALHARVLHQNFTARCGASICKDIKGTETGRMLCSCEDCVRNAVKVLEEIRNV